MSNLTHCQATNSVKAPRAISTVNATYGLKMTITLMHQVNGAMLEAAKCRCLTAAVAMFNVTAKRRNDETRDTPKYEHLFS